jgi:RNA polymerase sigma factor (sigma-70 family)
VSEIIFREAYGQLVSRLSCVFGLQHLLLIEDVVQDSLLIALEVWKFKGVPENPTGWLYKVARNKMIDALRKDKVRTSVDPLLLSGYTQQLKIPPVEDSSLIMDDTLRMMFVCCHPKISQEAQIALCLKTLCGFSVREIASACITSEETITKRLYRAREVLRSLNIKTDDQEDSYFEIRLEGVLRTIYLIFTEGYNATHQDGVIRKDVAEDAIRLAFMLTHAEKTSTPATYALLALMCFQSARLASRVDEHGDLISLQHQDRSVWDTDLIQQGLTYLAKSANGNVISTYHLEAGIAYEHIKASSYEHTNWNQIVSLYEQLYEKNPSDVVLLNQLIAKSFTHGVAHVLDVVRSSTLKKSLQDYYLFHATLADWYVERKDYIQAKEHLLFAIQLTKAPAEKRFLEKKLISL